MATQKKPCKDDESDVEVSTPWFKMKLDDINYKTIIIVAMILITIVVILK